jgi:type I restriction enzyme S subunit
VRRYVKGSAQPGLNLGDVETFLVPVPAPDEQRAVTAILSSASAQIEGEKRQLEKLRFLRLGLTEDLLTGRVRLIPLLEGGVT